MLNVLLIKLFQSVTMPGDPSFSAGCALFTAVFVLSLDVGRVSVGRGVLAYARATRGVQGDKCARGRNDRTGAGNIGFWQVYSHGYISDELRACAEKVANPAIHTTTARPSPPSRHRTAHSLPDRKAFQIPLIPCLYITYNVPRAREATFAVARWRHPHPPAPFN